MRCTGGSIGNRVDCIWRLECRVGMAVDVSDAFKALSGPGFVVASSRRAADVISAAKDVNEAPSTGQPGGARAAHKDPKRATWDLMTGLKGGASGHRRSICGSAPKFAAALALALLAAKRARRGSNLFRSGPALDAAAAT